MVHFILTHTIAFYKLIRTEGDDTQRNLFDGFRECGTAENFIKSLGKALKGSENAFIHDGHYRRFINMDEFVSSCEKVGFKVTYAEESDEFAPFGSQKPTCIRVVAVKMGT